MNMGEASLINAQIVLKQFNAPSLNSMLKGGHPFIALGTLLFTPFSLADAQGFASNNPLFLDRNTLLNFAKAYPTLEAALTGNFGSRKKVKEYIIFVLIPVKVDAEKWKKIENLRPRDLISYKGNFL